MLSLGCFWKTSDLVLVLVLVPRKTPTRAELGKEKGEDENRNDPSEHSLSGHGPSEPGPSEHGPSERGPSKHGQNTSQTIVDSRN